MIYNKTDIIKYRIEKSATVFREAELLISSGLWSGAINRLYYSCFHLVSALLLKSDISASTHNGVRTKFFQEFIKTGKIDKIYSVLYSDLMNKRQESDYDDFFEFTEDDVNALFDEVRTFQSVIKSEIEK